MCKESTGRPVLVRYLVKRGDLNGQAYQDNIINDIKLQYECTKQRISLPTINELCHNYSNTRTLVWDQGIEILDWLSNNSDMSPLETV